MRTLLFSLALCLSGCGFAPDTPVDPSATDTFIFEVPNGSAASSLGPALAEQGLVRSPFHWKVFLRLEQPTCLKAGRFEVQRSLSMRQLMETLCGVPLSDDVPFTVVEGWRIQDTDRALADAGFIEPGAYASIALNKSVEAPFDVVGATYEGFLYPETYQVNPDAFSASEFVQRQLAMFAERFVEPHGDQLGGRTLHEIVVMASMLEREEPKPSNRPLVAGILWKRIDANTPLGVDATSRYTLDEWNDRKAFLKKLRDPSDPYNTRLKEGLPPTAIGSTTLPSLKAAIAPEPSEFWYYLHDATGTLRPARNGDEHEANRKTYNVY